MVEGNGNKQQETMTIIYYNACNTGNDMALNTGIAPSLNEVTR